MPQPAEPAAVRTVRCAIYTRKSTEEGLGQEFNSLDAQRECAEAYIQSQRPEGWTVLPERYDDGGFSGAHLERPALQRLLHQIADQHIDCVVVYKVDRLSRSLFDFARLMQIFEKHGISFVSVTQQLNSHTPMGRLTLHILLSFAQFERELIGERTRDKKSAARRKGKWMGGYPLLGYDAAPGAGGLRVNEQEAEQVRDIFDLYLRQGSLASTLAEVDRRGWRMKSWTTRQGKPRAGGSFDRAALGRLLRNVVYVGEVSHRGKVYAGEQVAIVDREVWQRANHLLRREQRKSSPRRPGALLQGRLECALCGGRMVRGATTKRQRQYIYYVCLARQQGVSHCSGQSIAAGRIEQAVVEAIRGLAGGMEDKAMQEALQRWNVLEPNAQQDTLARAVSRISYDGRSGQAALRLQGPDREVSIVVKGPVPSPTPVAPPETPTLNAVAARLPRITRLLALAVRFEGLLRDGTVRDYAELARLGGVSRARITQIMNLRNLAPALQERILLLPVGTETGGELNERAVRRVMQHLDWRTQQRMMEEMWKEQ